jgi:PST family polysaccharide transporter
MIEKLKITAKKLIGSKVFENYFSMTFIQGANLIIGLLLYPYLIRVLGKSAYGSYVFALSVVAFFSIFVSFGFHIPALKEVSLFPNDWEKKNKTVSAVFTAKSILFVIALFIFCVIIFIFPFFRKNYPLYLIAFSTIVSEVLFFTWFFQGIQNMKVVTIIQVSMKLLLMPFVFIFIKSSENLLLYALFVAIFNNFGAIVSLIYLKIKENIGLHFVSTKELKVLFRDALPFFWTSIIGTIKKESVTLTIGKFFGMADVALYDLAVKIVNIARMFTENINAAIFPKIVVDAQPDKIKKIIRYETIITLGMIAIIAAFGYWAVLLLGGKNMIAAYPITVILSTIIYSWLIVGCYLEFVFVPNNKYYFVTKNQVVALISFLILTGIFFLVHKSILLIVLAYVLSGLIEIIYCKYLINKHKLL